MTMSTVRKHLTTLLTGAVAIALLLTGCASNSSPGVEASTKPQTSGKGVFPVTINTAYGEITVSKKPERIFVFNTSNLEALSYVGEKPIAWSSGASTKDELSKWNHWWKDLATSIPDPDPRFYDMGQYSLVAEAIAAIKPDLILADIWNVNEQVYKQLSQIAPTYVGIETKAQTSWQDNFAAIASLTGHDPKVVDKLETEVNAEFAAAAKRLSGLQGKTFLVAATDDKGVFWPTGYANQPILALGLKPAHNQPKTSGTADSQKFSQENIEQADADVVFFVTEHRDPSGETQRKLEADPRLKNLPAAKNGTLVFLSPVSLWSAINGGTPASYRWWLKQEPITQLEKSALNQSGR